MSISTQDSIEARLETIRKCEGLALRIYIQILQRLGVVGLYFCYETNHFVGFNFLYLQIISIKFILTFRVELLANYT